MRICLYGLTLALVGCATTPIPLAPSVVTAKVAVTTSCVSEIPKRPELIAEQTWATSQNEWERERALRVDRERLLSHVDKLEATLTACAPVAKP